MSTHPDWDVRFLDGLGVEADAVELVILPVKLRFRFGPENLEHLQELVAHGAAVSIGNAQGVELLLQPAHADAAYHPAVGQHVQRREHLGLHHRVAVGQDHHRAPQPDYVGTSGHISQQGHGLQERVFCRTCEGTVGGVGVLVRTGGGEHDVVPGQRRLETQGFRPPHEPLQAITIEQLRNA